MRKFLHINKFLALIGLCTALSISAFGQSSSGGASAGIVSSFSGANDGSIGAIPSINWVGPHYAFLPIEQVNVTFPNVSSYTTVTVCASGCTYTTSQYQTALNYGAANCDTGGITGVIISVAQGTTITGNFNLPVSNCTTDWVITETTGLSWTRGVRIDPSSATNGVGIMAHFLETDNEPVFCTYTNCSGSETQDAGVDRYWFSGIEMDCQGNNNTNVTYFCFETGDYATTPAALPDYIILDHVYIHGHIDNQLRHGFEMDANNMAFVDGYCSDVHNVGSDSQCAFELTGGPKLVQNSFQSATSEIRIVGGGEQAGGLENPPYGLVSHDETDNQVFYFKPRAWDPYSALGEFYGGEENGLLQDVKNCWEQKSGVRTLFENSVCENGWGETQFHDCVLIQPVLSSGTPVTGGYNGIMTDHLSDTTIENVDCYSFPVGINMSGNDADWSSEGGCGLGIGPGQCADPVHRTDRITIINDLFDNVNEEFVGSYASHEVLFTDSNGVDSAIYSHNTALLNGLLNITGTSAYPWSYPFNNDSVYPTIWPETNYWASNVMLVSFAKNLGTVSTTGYTEGNLSIAAGFKNPLGTPFTNMVVEGEPTPGDYSSGFQFPASVAAMGFMNYNGGNAGPANVGNYALTSGSTYSATGTHHCTANPNDGPAADCGVNTTELASAISGVVQFPANAPTLTSFSPSSAVCNGTNTFTANGTNFTLQGTEWMVRGTQVTASSVTSTSAVLTTPSVSKTGTITADSAPNLDNSQTIQYTTSTTFVIGDIVTASGLSNTMTDGTTFNQTGVVIGYGSGVVTIFIPPSTRLTFPITSLMADSGTLTLDSVPVVVDNFGLPVVQQFTCN